MTTDTIKDVLGRIISINKNLTEDSLRNLLAASGWENTDIEQGIKVFHDYSVPMNMPPTPPVAVAPAPEVGAITVEAVVPATVVIATNTETVEVDDLVDPVQPVQIVPFKSVTPTFSVDDNLVVAIPTTQKPWALIAIDVVLFLIALGLLVYIIIN